MKKPYLVSLMILTGIYFCHTQEIKNDTITTSSQKIKNQDGIYHFPLNEEVSVKAHFVDLPENIFALKQKDGQITINSLAVIKAKNNEKKCLYDLGPSIDYTLANQKLISAIKKNTFDEGVKKDSGVIIYKDNTPNKYMSNADIKLFVLSQTKNLSNEEFSISLKDIFTLSKIDNCEVNQCPHYIMNN